MKRYSLVVILHIIGICLLSVVIYLLIQDNCGLAH